MRRLERASPAKKPRVFSAIQPTGHLHIGNYLGAITQWVAHQNERENLFCVADLHAITVPETIQPSQLRSQIREVAALILASGIDPERSTLFVQSHVSAHAELSWILDCVTPVSWLFGMTQYKIKTSANERVSAGLLNYPALMAADILLYDTDEVPVGDDQKQHVEVTRDIAERFNHLFGETFHVPAPVIPDIGARVMCLDDPTQKMSKSIAALKPDHAIEMLDIPERIGQKLARAVTDSSNETRIAHASPGVRNLIELYAALAKEAPDEVGQRFAGAGYGTLKRAVADAVIETLAPIQKRARDLLDDPAELDALLARGADRVRPIAASTLGRAKDAIGLA